MTIFKGFLHPVKIKKALYTDSAFSFHFLLFSHYPGNRLYQKRSGVLPTFVYLYTTP